MNVTTSRHKSHPVNVIASWCIAVEWQEPMPGLAVYGPYIDEDQAKNDWPNVQADFCNEDELPEDVEAHFNQCISRT